MRLRNVPGSREFIDTNEYTIKDPENYAGKWRELFNLDPESELHIEIGMGKGRFISELATKNPSVCYLGIEKFSSVLVRALEKRNELSINNLYMLRFDAENITSIFNENEVDRIYLNFSDPWPKDRHAKRRLTSTQFLSKYDYILNKKGNLIFKTDNRTLFDFSLEQVALAGWNLIDCQFDLHSSESCEGNIMTEYEEKFSSQGVPICRMIIDR